MLTKVLSPHFTVHLYLACVCALCSGQGKLECACVCGRNKESSRFEPQVEHLEEERWMLASAALTSDSRARLQRSSLSAQDA
jgi:hypothetical protein